MKNKKLVIFLACVVTVFLIITIRIFLYRGAVPDYFREKTDIFIPDFAADEYIDLSSFTDTLKFCRFDLNKREAEKIKKDIETNDTWHKYSDKSINPSELIPGGGTDEMDAAISEIDFSNCYVVVYNYHDDEPVRTFDEIAPSFTLVAYDEVNKAYYYLEMIW